MKKRNAPVWLLALVAAVLLAALSADGLAQSKLKGFGRTVQIDVLEGFMSAEHIVIDRGTTVIWHNATDKAVNIVFGIGEKVKRACVAPTRFVLQGGEYWAQSIPPGGVASLCFVQSGTFDYSAAPDGVPGGEGSKPARGLISVRSGKPAGA